MEKQVIDLADSPDDWLDTTDFTGGGQPDLIVKDRYWNIYTVAHDGRPLWKYSGNNIGHQVMAADIDGDGLDEVFTGVALIDHDGTLLWERSPEEQIAAGHADQCHILQIDGETRLVYCIDGLYCVDVRGNFVWRTKLAHAQ